jgi:hypothetical protein
LANRQISVLDPLNLPAPAPATNNPAAPIVVKTFLCPSTPNGQALANYDSIMSTYPGFPPRDIVIRVAIIGRCVVLRPTR